MKHRIARWGLLPAAAIALSGAARAQNVPAQFVVTGKAFRAATASRARPAFLLIFLTCRKSLRSYLQGGLIPF